MKNLILGISLILSSIAFSAHASDSMAQVTVKENASYEKALVDLFAKEAKKPNSKISNYLSALKADPDNDGFQIDDTITETEIVRLDSGASYETYEINYLIIIRAGYKSNTFSVGYLKAQAIGSMEGKPTVISITSPAKVVIE